MLIITSVSYNKKLVRYGYKKTYFFEVVLEVLLLSQHLNEIIIIVTLQKTPQYSC